MNLKKQVCSLNLAKRLQRHGIIQNSLFYHMETDKKKKSSKYALVSMSEYLTVRNNTISKGYSAFTTGELMELFINEKKFPEKLKWLSGVSNGKKNRWIFDKFSSADALAKLLDCCIIIGAIKVKYINQKLR